MAKKKDSETLAQRRKAQQDFLELKKMQAGEMAPPPKPSEEAVMPRTFKEKLQNYWFHYKWQTIATVFTAVILAVLISQCASRTAWDMNIVYFTYTPVLDEQTRLVADYFEDICGDINDDGEIHVNVTNCSVSKDTNVQYKNTMLTKLQALITAEPTAQLYITDSESIKYFEVDALNNFFATEQIKLDEDFYEKTRSETLGKLPDGLQIACRRVEGTLMDKNEDVDKVYKESNKILSKLEKK